MPATTAAQKVRKGSKLTMTKKTRSTVHFHRPKTLALARNPKYARRAVPQPAPMDKFNILRFPVTTEAAMKMVEDENTIVFLVDRRANKGAIAQAFKSCYEISPARVNTLIKPDGSKKAFVRIPAGTAAVDVASKVGLL
ncbi:Ribosomal protein L25/L23 [Carpediemonas membranifera]|uniref:Ribosomal protein L25/L23 n=1 Tax=Carpediemonas membranifera TaxID=201153 RepID=A0A8J6B0I7_9EUKA|nr:Ribosomal protein L25/L23 [Carpediemonas membranifera]|eukprot:KAG9391654.1 Ribosomal protein L25/L23 [Carpediemonas membranifera]